MKLTRMNFLKQDLDMCNSSDSCCGGCKVHRGKLKTVRVVDGKDGYDWGFFSIL